MANEDLWVVVLVVILVESLFLHFAAKFLTTNPRFLSALLVAVLGGLLSGLVLFLVPNAILGVILAVVAWLAVCASIYRIGMFRSLLLGLLAWVLFAIVRWLLGVVFRELRLG